jgi:hypothetical protein
MCSDVTVLETGTESVRTKPTTAKPSLSRIDDVHAVVGLNERGTTIEGLLRLLRTATSLRVNFSANGA